MARIIDIAKAAQVSTATVSRILSEDPSLSVSDETRKRVREIAREMGYRPERRRKKKPAKEKGINPIGMVLVNDEAADPYFRFIREGIESVCENYSMQIASVFQVGRSDFSRESMAHLDGLLVIGDVNIQELIGVFGEKKPIVYVDFIPDEAHDAVVSDLESAMARILDYLVGLGHSRIAYVGGNGRIMNISRGELIEKEDVRLKAFRRMMKEKGLFRPQYVKIGEFSSQSGCDLMKELLTEEEIPSAAVAGSDPIAIGALKAIHEASVRVPEDLSIVSFDDIEAAAFLNPPLSTVRVHTEEMGRTAVKLLRDRLTTGRELPLKVVLPTELVLRESSGINNS